LFDNHGVNIGEVTSGTMSPCLKTGIGMGFVETRCSAPGNNIRVGIRDKQLQARVVKMPFFTGKCE
jgi:aminomethyltransferase